MSKTKFIDRLYNFNYCQKYSSIMNSLLKLVKRIFDNLKFSLPMVIFVGKFLQ